MEMIKTWESNGVQPLVIEADVLVEHGANQLEIVAKNVSAAKDDEIQETSRQLVFVHRATPPMAPTLAFEEIAAISDQNESIVLNSDSQVSDKFRTSWPQVRIRGSLIAKSKIGSAELVFGGKRNKLTDFVADQVQEFQFVETLHLQPGRNPIVVEASVADVKDEKRIVVIYEPPVPNIATMELKSISIRPLPPAIAVDETKLFAGYVERTIEVTASLDGHLEHPYEITIRLNDVSIDDDDVKIDRASADLHRVSAKLKLSGGKNSITLHVKNKWSDESESKQVVVSYQRPPEIVSIEGEKILQGKSLNLSCQIRSEIPLRSAKVFVDGETDERISTFAEVAGNPGEYQLMASDLGLSTGQHVIYFTAANDEGEALLRGQHEVTVKDATKPPSLEIVGPLVTGASPARKIMVQYKVGSAVPVKVRMMHTWKVGTANEKTAVTFEPKDVVAEGTLANFEIELAAGPNTIELIAENSGGCSEKRNLEFSYIADPVTVEIVSIDGLFRRNRGDGKLAFDQSASKSRVQLIGRVKIKTAGGQDQKLSARIFVNSFMVSAKVIADPNDRSTGIIQAEIVLNKPQDNKIEIEVYDAGQLMPKMLDNKDTATIDCENYERGQDLYLLVFGTGDEERLRKNLRTVVKATPNEHKPKSIENWKSQLFSKVHFFNAVNKSSSEVSAKIDDLVKSMNENVRSKKNNVANSIVMVFFQGRIDESRDDFKFATSNLAQQSRTSNAITGKLLQRKLNSALGAHLLFLDLTQNEKNLKTLDIWPKVPQLGIIMSNWTDQQAQPSDASLLSALEEALPQNRIVRGLAANVKTRLKKYPDSIEEFVNVDRVENVRIGKVEP